MGLNARTHLYAQQFFEADFPELSESALQRAWHTSSAEARQPYLDRASAKIRKEQGRE